jgi:hypothetical protein
VKAKITQLAEEDYNKDHLQRPVVLGASWNWRAGCTWQEEAYSTRLKKPARYG